MNDEINNSLSPTILNLYVYLYIVASTSGKKTITEV